MVTSLLCSEEIQNQLEALRSEGYPPSAVCRFWENLVRFCTGPDAEAAVVELIDKLEDDERMSALVRSYVMREGRSCPDHTGTHAPFVLIELAEQGFSPIQDSTGIHVGMPDGQVIDEPWNGKTRTGHTICAAALKAVALQTIRNRHTTFSISVR